MADNNFARKPSNLWQFFIHFWKIANGIDALTLSLQYWPQRRQKKIHSIFVVGDPNQEKKKRYLSTESAAWANLVQLKYSAVLVSLVTDKNSARVKKRTSVMQIGSEQRKKN